MNRQYETIHHFVIDECSVRVWLSQDSDCEVNIAKSFIAAMRSQVKAKKIEDILALAEEIGSYPRVAAVEVLKDGVGVIIYPDWK